MKEVEERKDTLTRTYINHDGKTDMKEIQEHERGGGTQGYTHTH